MSEKCRTRWGLISYVLMACGAAPAATGSPSTPGDTANGEPSHDECDGLSECESECKDGNATSCEWLGHMHETGDGAGQDYERAARFYEQACEAGLDESCAHLAMMYDIGLAVEEDPKRASRLYKKACDAGNRWACKRGDELQ